MAKKVKEVWKDEPPTQEDAAMRTKHVKDSVAYNHHHAEDHLKEIPNQLSKLKKTDPGLAKKLGKEAVAKIHNMAKKVHHG